MEKRNLVQSCAIKFCVKLNENATETCEKLIRAYGELAVSRTQVFRWQKAFLDGREGVEDEPRSGRSCTSKTDENVTKVRDWQSEWSVVCWIWIAKPSTKIWPSKWACRKFAPSWSQKFSQVNRRKTEFLAKKRYFSDSAATILAWSESVWLLPFPKTQIPLRRSSFWELWTSKGRDRPAEGIFTWRPPALLPGVGETSPAVCGFPRELLWRR